MEINPVLLEKGPCRPALNALGDVSILQQPLLGVFCSVKCPASLILKAHDVAKELAVQGMTVLIGFQSPVEKEMLTVLLRGNGSIVVCPARGLAGMRIPMDWRPAIDVGKMLVLSPFNRQLKRTTSELATERNRLVIVLAGRALVIHAEPGGRLETLTREMLAAGKQVYTLPNVGNQHLVEMGAGIHKETPDFLGMLGQAAIEPIHL